MTRKILDIVSKTGIEDWGVCSFSAVADKLIECRAKQRLPKNAKSILLCVFPYKVKDDSPQKISRYAAVPDYHNVCGEYLEKAKKALKEKFPQNEFEVFIDNSPIPEVFAAANAGLGVFGQNGLLINQKYGSYVFIGEIVTDLELEAQGEFSLCCQCGMCKSVCPVGQDKQNCLSKISQKKGELEETEKALLLQNGIMWGCDICAESCPENKNARNTYITEFIDGYRNEYTLGEDISQRAYNWRGEKTIARNARIFKTNS